VVVAQLGSRQIYENREIIVDALWNLMSPSAVVTSVSDDASRLEVIPTGRELVRGDLGGAVEVLEHGVRFSIDPLAGQKTGFFADQRENRTRFAALCKDKNVLDLYSYVGAFGLHAARAGASSVLSVETSAPALKLLAENARLNGHEEKIQTHAGDVMTFMKEARAQGRRWDRIICDPPKFARGRSHLDDAVKKYARLNTLAMACLDPGGLLLTCSCSQHVSERDFLRLLTDAGHRLRRGVEVHGVWGQAPDHPFSAVAPEGRYLKAALISLA
jgi:23S rRNA (cytosine1962-C5)-methyltransferase